MVDVIIIYDTVSTSGTTEKAAALVLEGAKSSGATAEMKRVEDVTMEEIRNAGGVILGSPNITNNISGRMREFCAGHFKNAKVNGKPGAAFGTYKWNRGNLRRLEFEMRNEGVMLAASGVEAHHRLTAESEQALVALGESVGREVLKLKSGK
ncbi:MAG TPA: FprA family A-type flavoprotein [Methanocella sp.]|nr:FprA family A-type flavoprotein [Methanocella sp.]